MAMKPLQPSNSQLPRSAYLLIALIIIYIISVLVHLGYFPLNNEEPRRAIVAIEMLHSGNFVMPTTMGWEYYNKPPVYNWLIGLCMWLTGSTSETAVRLPSLIFILIWAFCNYHIVKRILPKEIAFLSSLFLVTSVDIYFWGLSNGGEIDIFYSFIVYLQAILIFYANQRQRWLTLYVLSYLFCGIGFLTKGFPSLIFQALTLASLCVFNRSIRVIFKWQHLAGIGVFAIVVGGYLYAYSFHSSPGILLADLLKESFNKSAFGEYQEKLLSKIISYPFSFLKILLPWSLLLLLLFKKHRFRLWSNPVIRFSVLFILFNIPVYWFTGHPRMRYVYMFLPFCMIILAYIFYYFREEYPRLVGKIIRYGIGVLAIVFAGIVIAPFFLKIDLVLALSGVGLYFLYLFFSKKSTGYIGYFAGGIVMMRLVYALVFIPVRYEGTMVKYDKEMAVMAGVNNFQPVTIYRRPDTLNLVIDLKISKLNFGTIPAIPYMAYQMPYYYFRNTGQLVRFDTVIQQNKRYIGYRSSLEGLNPDILYSFRDKNQFNEEVVLFTIPERHYPGITSSPVKGFLKR
jgi:4-amino-4-deoxy-L-arabinose transferase-like glycosyltransferase